jgi:hypothetical protein
MTASLPEQRYLTRRATQLNAAPSAAHTAAVADGLGVAERPERSGGE